MMKTRSVLGVVFIAVFLLTGVTTAFSAGYPVVAVMTPTDPDGTSLVIVGKFDQAAFTEGQADDLSDAVVSLLGSLNIGGGAPVVFKPSVLRSQYGLTDADALKGLVKGIYRGAGFDLYAFLDITKKPSISAQYGNNIKVDVWVADLGTLLGFPGEYLYAATLETPEMFTGFLSLL